MLRASFAWPSASLRKTCIYSADYVQSHYTAPVTGSQPQFQSHGPLSIRSLPQTGVATQEDPRLSMMVQAMQSIGSLEVGVLPINAFRFLSIR